MEITWYGHSCFRLVERGMASVVTDPYDAAVTGYEPLKLKADIVTVSHDSPGHNQIAVVKNRQHVLTGPGEYEIGGVFITGLRIDTNKRDEAQNRNTVFVFDFEDISVVHLGDLGRMPTQAEIEALGEINIALVPVGGGLGLSPAKAAEVISLLEPAIVIPMHYALDGSKLPLAPLSKFLKEMGLGEVAVEQSLKVTRSNLPEETRIIVLESRTS